MITITVTLPPKIDSKIVDAITVTVMDDTRDRQPRSTFLEGLRNQPSEVVLTFTD